MTNNLTNDKNNTIKICNFIKTFDKNTIFVGISNQSIANAHVDINSILIDEQKKSKNNNLNYIFYFVDNNTETLTLSQKPESKTNFQLDKLKTDELDKIKNRLCQLVTTPDITTLMLHVFEMSVDNFITIDPNSYFNNLLENMNSKSKNIILTIFNNKTKYGVIFKPSTIKLVGGSTSNNQNKQFINYNTIAKEYYNTLSDQEKVEFEQDLYNEVVKGLTNLYNNNDYDNDDIECDIDDNDLSNVSLKKKPITIIALTDNINNDEETTISNTKYSLLDNILIIFLILLALLIIYKFVFKNNE